MMVCWLAVAAQGWAAPAARAPMSAPRAAHRTAPRAMAEPEPTDAERRANLKKIFGSGFMDAEERELRRGAGVKQGRRLEAPTAPEWTEPAPDGLQTPEFAARRLTLWLEDSGVSMDNVLVVRAGAQDRLACVAATAVPAGATLFEIPESLLVTAAVALADPDLGGDLRLMAARQPGAGFDTFAIASMLAAERVRRGAVKGRLRRLDGGIFGGALEGNAGRAREVLPQWGVADRGTVQTNREFSPLVDSLEWPDEEECVVELGRAEAVTQGAELIAKLIEKPARMAWMRATQGSGLAQATSAEDTLCTATQALLVAIEAQLDPPPPLGEPGGEARWGGARALDGPAICPLANLVLPPPGVDAAEARAAGVFNAQIGRPRTGNVDAALRCVATRAMLPGELVLSDVPGMGAPRAPARAPGAVRKGDRVRVVDGPLAGQQGVVLLLRKAKEGSGGAETPIVRLDGEEKKMVALPMERLRRAGAEAGLKSRVM